jgi:hypothetical protein
MLTLVKDVPITEKLQTLSDGTKVLTPLGTGFVTHGIYVHLDGGEFCSIFQVVAVLD